jgi:hypothetical protein
MNRLNPQEQSIMLPILTEHLQINAGLSNLISSPITAAITATNYSSEYILQLRSFLTSILTSSPYYITKPNIK